MVDHEVETSIILHKYSNHFSASHALITEDLVEGLHGHNYYAEIEIFGRLNSNGIIFDYLSLDDSIKAFTLKWDHYTLLPRLNEGITYKKNGDNIDIRYGDRFYSIPSDEIRFLDCSNITTEILTRLLAQTIKEFLEQEGKIDDIKVLKVVIWETPTYSASHTIHL